MHHWEGPTGVQHAVDMTSCPLRAVRYYTSEQMTVHLSSNNYIFIDTCRPTPNPLSLAAWHI